VDPEVTRAFDEAIRVLIDKGATVIDIELPHMAYAVPVYYLTAPVQLTNTQSRSIRSAFNAVVARLICITGVRVRS
jgi:Asp-tRNA(Asn)/Glu-tRNA(Gln) amidotransferase A subunit family amidase